MTNLSDLFPAGAGKQVSFTASGNVTSSGKPVILNSDGTVSEVSGTSESIGSKTDPLVANAGSYNYLQGVQRDVIYDTTADRVILAAQCSQSGANNQIRVVAGQVSGSTCTFGSSINVDSTETGTGINVPANNASLCYDEDNGFPLLFVQSASASYPGYPVLVPLVVSGSTISLGTPLVVESVGCTNYANFCTYDTTNDKVLCVYGSVTLSNYLRAAVVTVSSTSSLSVTGSPVTEPANVAVNQNWYLTYDPSADLHFLCGSLGTPHFYGTTIDISTGTAVWKSSMDTVDTPTGSPGYPVSTYDSTSQAIITSFYNTPDGGSTYTNELVVVVLSGSGASTTITKGTNGNTGFAAYNYYGAPVYDPDKNVTGISYNTSSGVSYATITLTGASPYTVSVGTATVMDSSGSTYGSQNIGVYDPDTDQICNIGGLTGSHACIMYSPGSTNVTASNFLGISDAAISSAASGNITIKGGIAATGLSSLTPASDYYVQNDGTITTSTDGVNAGKALSATAINLEYTS